MGVALGGGWTEPVRNGPYFWYGPLWMPFGALVALIWAPQAHFPNFPNFQIFVLGHFLESFRGGPCGQPAPIVQKIFGQIATCGPEC